MRLARQREPFDHAEWVYELKYDGDPRLMRDGMRAPRLVRRKSLIRLRN